MDDTVGDVNMLILDVFEKTQLELHATSGPYINIIHQRVGKYYAGREDSIPCRPLSNLAIDLFFAMICTDTLTINSRL